MTLLTLLSAASTYLLSVALMPLVRRAAVHHKLLGRYGVLPEEFAMVGDSLRTDVLPVIEIGGRAYHVPAPTTAEAVGSGPAAESGYRTLARLSELLQVLDTPEGEGP